jgi:hypothetical protein
LFQADDDEGLAAAIRRLANAPELREELRRAGIETAGQYTEEGYNRAVETALLAAVAASGDPAAASGLAA